MLKRLSIFAVCAVALWSLAGQAQADPAPDVDDLSGFWCVIDKAGDVSIVSVHRAKPATERDEIAKKKIYLICWVKDGHPTQGIMDRKGAMLAVAWIDGPGGLGVSVYEIKGAGKSMTIHGPSESWHKLKVGGDV